MRGGVLGGQLFLLSTTGEKSPVFFMERNGAPTLSSFIL